MRIIFINTPGHSQSTVLGALLSNLPKSICIGESYNLFTRDLSLRGPESTNEYCSCGKPYAACSFWKPFFQSQLPDLNTHYKKLISIADNQGFSTIIETCSKPACRELWLEQGLDMVILTMRRPFNRWLQSMRNAEKRVNAPSKSFLFYLKDYYITKVWKRRLLSIGHKVDFGMLEEIIGWEDQKHHIAIGNRCKYDLPGANLPAKLIK